MNAQDIKEMIKESKKQKHSVEIERLQKILEQLEIHRKSNVITKIEYWKAK